MSSTWTWTKGAYDTEPDPDYIECGRCGFWYLPDHQFTKVNVRSTESKYPGHEIQVICSVCLADRLRYALSQKP